MIIWADNYQAYGTDTAKLSDGLYAQVSTTSYLTIVNDPDPNALAGSKAMRFSSSAAGTADQLLRYAFPTGVETTVGTSIRVWMPDLPQSSTMALEPFSFRDVSNNILLMMEVLSNGSLQLVRGGEGSTVLGTSTLPVILANSWNHIEIKVTFSNTEGLTEVRVNGEVVDGLTLSNVDTIATGNVGAAQVAVLQRATLGSSRQIYYFKDLIVWNTSGTENNDFLGVCQVLTLRPDGDLLQNWTPSTGSTLYDLLADSAGPNDTTYMSATSSAIDVAELSLENLPPNIGSVLGVIPVVRARKIDGGTGNIQTGLVSNGQSDLGVNRPITTAFTYWYDVSETNPDTGLPYTPLDIDNVSMTIKRTQ